MYSTKLPGALVRLAAVSVLMLSPFAVAGPKPAPAAKSAPAKPASSGAKPASDGAASHATGAGGASHGPSTASHGPSTGGASASHGPTTAGAKAGGAAAGGARPASAGVAHGAMAHPGPAGSHEMRAANGSGVRMRANGRPSDVHDARRGMDIHHNLAGGRRVMVERADHSRMFYERGRAGYISHAYGFRGHEFARRSYYWHGRAYDRFYRPYGFHGVDLEVYEPSLFYPVAFYGWAYQPWGVPVRYSFGFGGAPWFGYYGAYYAPYPVYAGPNYWLTDYMISQSLQAQYEAQAANGAPPPLGDVTPLSPAVKQQVAEEVQRQLALESQEAQQNGQQQDPDPASSGIARVLSDGQPHVFVAGREVDVVDAAGQECAVTDGDVLQLSGSPAPADTTARLVVVASKGSQDCRRADVVTVPLDELQEMYNHMRETVDQGLQELQAKQGGGGLPPAPPSAKVAPAPAAMAAAAPPPDPAGATELAQQEVQAQQSEQEVLQATAAPAGGPSAPDTVVAAPVEPTSVSIANGQSKEQVKAAQGEPLRIVNLGTKSIFVYKDMKVTFLNGKVSNIE